MVLAGAMALAADPGMSMSTTTQATGSCDRFCKTEYTPRWYSCTPGNTPCHDPCRDNDCSGYAEACP